MPTTRGRLKLPIPVGGDAPAIPADFGSLADRINVVSGAGVVFVADATARAALVTNADVFNGLYVYQDDTKETWRYFSGWKLWDVPYKTFTPSLVTGTLGNGTLVGGFSVSSGQMEGWAKWTFGSTSAIASGGGVLAPPVAMDSSLPVYSSLGTVFMRDQSSGDFHNGHLVIGANLGEMLPLRALQPASYTAAQMGQLGSIASSSPLPWTNLDSISYAFRAPAA